MREDIAIIHEMQVDDEDEANEGSNEDSCEPDLTGDYHNIALLVGLYILQGVPLGLLSAVPLMLQSRHISLSQQGVFYFANYPFSMKLLWAPIVDCLFIRKVGRRKSWLIPTQYTLSVFLITSSLFMDDLLPKETAFADKGNMKTMSDRQIYLLTAIFFTIDFLTATQDIIVDGWAITMLQKRNAGYQGTCNIIGQNIGIFFGTSVFLALESGDFCHQYLWFLYANPESHEGLVTLSSFLSFMGLVFIVTTSLVMVFKRETSDRDGSEYNRGILQSYHTLYQIFSLKPVQVFTLILVSHKIGIIVTQVALDLKLVEFGVRKEYLSMTNVAQLPVVILFSMLVARSTSGSQPLSTFVRAYPFALLTGLFGAGVAWFTSYISSGDGSFPVYYYVILVLHSISYQMCASAMSISFLGMSAKVSDPRIGGTYMTLLATLTNVGNDVLSSLVLFTLPWFSIRFPGGPFIDGFYAQTAFASLTGLAWIVWARQGIQWLQSLPASSWMIAEQPAKSSPIVKPDQNP